MAPRPVPRGVRGDRRTGRGDGPCQLAGGEPQQPAAELLHPATPPGLGLPEPASVLPEPPRAGAERPPRARGKDPRRSPDRPAPSPLAGNAGLQALHTQLTRARPATPPRTLLSEAWRRSVLLPQNGGF